MGSFSVVCAGSGMSITSGDEAAIILLVPRRNSDPVLKPMSMMVFNEGPQGLYTPFALPIFGRYNDYGSLEDIERNVTVEVLEKFFNVGIDTILEIVTRNWCEDLTKENKLSNEDIMKKMSACFFNREIFNYLADYKANYGYEGSRDWLRDGEINEASLKAMGFVLADEADARSVNNKDDRYKKTYVFPGENDVCVHSDGTWSYIKSGKKKTDSLYHPGAFIEGWNKVSTVKIDPDKFSGLSSLHFDYDEISKRKPAIELDELKKMMENPETTEEATELLLNSFETLRNPIEHVLPLLRWSSKTGSLSELYGDKMRAGDPNLKEEFLRTFALTRNMYSNNRIFIPGYNGPQCGARKEQFVFASKIAEVLKAQLEERGNEDEDEE